eukprot:1866345-Prymnesium_polylepis.1
MAVTQDNPHLHRVREQAHGNHMAIIWQSQDSPHLDRVRERAIARHHMAIAWQSHGNHMAITRQPAPRSRP